MKKFAFVVFVLMCLDSCKTDLTDIENHIKDVETQGQTLDNKVKQLKDESQRLSNAVKDLQNKSEELQKKSEELQKKSEELGEKSEELEKANQVLKDSLESLRNTSLELAAELLALQEEGMAPSFCLVPSTVGTLSQPVIQFWRRGRDSRVALRQRSWGSLTLTREGRCASPRGHVFLTGKSAPRCAHPATLARCDLAVRIPLLARWCSTVGTLSQPVILFWRRGRDSNPRDLSARRFSRPLHSTTLPPLRRWRYDTPLQHFLCPRVKSGPPAWPMVRCKCEKTNIAKVGVKKCKN